MHRDRVDTACAVIANLAKAQTFEDPDNQVFPGAAVFFDGALTLFPSDYRTGKSILTVALASRGCQLFSDDIVLLDRDEIYVPARFNSVCGGEALKRLLQWNFARVPEASRVLDRIYTSVASVDCFRLAYSEPDEAAVLLGEPGRIDEGTATSPEVISGLVEIQ